MCNMNKFSNKINVLINPTVQCNMNCIYCYNESNKSFDGKMSLTTLERIYELLCNNYEEVNIIWHGGEPLIMGLDFYEQAIALQSKYTNNKITNKMQSNLTLLTDEMADFFAKNNVFIGGSFDGLQNEDFRGHSELILKNREKLIRRGMQCGFISVVSKQNVDYLLENYNFFKTLNLNYTMNMYIPTDMSNKSNLSLEPIGTAIKIKEFYDYWVHDVVCNIHVNYFERMLDFIYLHKKNVCKYCSCLGMWLGIRHDGQIFPCNRNFSERYSYGNIYDYDDIANVFKSDGFYLILSEAVERRKKCQQCEIYDFCEGGCNNVAYSENGIANNNGPSCYIMREVFKHILYSTKTIDTNKNEYNPYFIRYYYRKKIKDDR